MNDIDKQIKALERQIKQLENEKYSLIPEISPQAINDLKKEYRLLCEPRYVEYAPPKYPNIRLVIELFWDSDVVPSYTVSDWSIAPHVNNAYPDIMKFIEYYVGNRPVDFYLAPKELLKLPEYQKYEKEIKDFCSRCDLLEKRHKNKFYFDRDIL